MPETPLPLVRTRINTSVSVKGIVTHECTVELVGAISGQIDVAHDEIAELVRYTKEAQKKLFDELRETYGQGEGFQPITPLAGALKDSLAEKAGAKDAGEAQ